jgi:hypothetical protein
VSLFFDLTQSLGILFVQSQSTSQGSGLFGTQVQGLVFLASVEDLELVPLGLRNDSQDTGNGFSDRFANHSGGSLISISFSEKINPSFE